MYPCWEVEAERPAKNAGRTFALMSEGLRLRNRSGWVDQGENPAGVSSPAGGLDWTEEPYSDPRLSPRACMSCRQLSLRRDPQRTGSQGQTVLPVVLHDRTFLTGALNGELSGTARTMGLIHQLLTQLIEPCGTGSGQGTLNVNGSDLMSRMGGRRGRGAGLEPERFRIECERTRRASGSVAELEPEFDGGRLRRRADQQEIGIANRMQGTGAA